MTTFVSNLGEFIIRAILIYAAFKFLFWLIDEGYLKYLLIGAALVGLFLWKTGRWDPPFLPENGVSEQGSRLQETTPPETRNSEDEFYRSAWNKGVCRTLDEDVHVVVIFLDDAESIWYDYTFNWLLRNKLEPGMKLIRQQAEAYGYPLDMEYSVYRDVKTDYTIVPFSPGFDPIEEIPDIAARAMGFSTPAEMLDYHQDYFQMEQILYFFCVNKHGRSYAHRSYASNSEAVEYCVFFTLYDSGWATSHATVPHEILHVFGAEDMYAEGSERVNREKLAFQLCPDDLMLCDEHRTPMVGRYTAYSVGWLDSMPEEYNRDDWWS